MIDSNRHPPSRGHGHVGLPAHPWSVFAACIAAFCALAWASGTSAGSDVDRWLLKQLQTPGEQLLPAGPGWLREAARDLTALGSVSVLSLGTLTASGWMLMLGRWRSAVLIVLTVAGGVAMSFALKLGFSQPRPDLVGQAPEVFTSSFPSSHAMSSLVVYLTVAVVLIREMKARRMRRYWLVVALLASVTAGLSRVYLGVHWPSDVLAGWLAGAAWLMLVVVTARRLVPGWLQADA